jgi:mannosyltransferase OCH1-like enzyme
MYNIPGTRIPKIIWTYRNTDFPKKIINSWISFNSDYTIVVLNNNNLKYYLKKDFTKFNILEEYGGIWLDDNVLCKGSLDKWFIKNVGKYSGDFVSFYDPSSGFTNWFFACKKNSKFIKKLRSGIYNFENTKLFNEDKLLIQI